MNAFEGESVSESNTAIFTVYSSTQSDSLNDVLNSLQYEINLKEFEKTACLESFRENYFVLNESSSSTELGIWDLESSDISCSEYSENSLVRELSDLDDSGSSWTAFSLESGFWEGDNMAGKRPLSYSEIDLSKKEKNGVLTQKIVSTGLSHLAQLPGSNEIVFTKLQLTSKELIDITVLKNYKKLMYVDLSDNKIEDMGIFSKMNYLIYLNLRNNRIKEMNLQEGKQMFATYLDVSHNQIDVIPNLDCLWSLTSLNISHNCITEIDGVWSLRYLKFLNLSHNKIEDFDVRLFSMNIKNLDLSHNIISFWKGNVEEITVAQSLLQLNLSCNHLNLLEPLKMLYWLEELDVSCNCIADMDQFKWLGNLRKLDSLCIDNNPVWENVESRGLLIHLVPSLSTLNGLDITTLERLNAAELFNSSLVQKAFQVYSWLLVKKDSSEIDSSQKFQSNVSIVVLVGPPGSGKWDIIKQLCDLHPNKAKMGRLVTTKEVGGSHMEHVSLDCFNSLIAAGKVITFEFRLGAGYALCWNALERDYIDQVILVGLELSSALSLKWQGLNPILVLSLTKDRDLHFERLKQLCQDNFNPNERFQSECFLTLSDLDKEDETLFPEEDEYQSFDEVSDSQSSQNYKTGLFEYEDPYATGFDQPQEMTESWLRYNNWSNSGNQSSVSLNKMDQIELNSSSPPPNDLSICITEEEVVEEEEIDEIYNKYKLFIDTVLNSRDDYIQLHEKMPGLFQYSVVTDHVNQAVKRVSDLLHTVSYDGYKNVKSSESYSAKEDPMYTEIVDLQIKNLMKSLAHKQGKEASKPSLTVQPPPEPILNKAKLFFNK